MHPWIKLTRYAHFIGKWPTDADCSSGSAVWKIILRGEELLVLLAGLLRVNNAEDFPKIQVELQIRIPHFLMKGFFFKNPHLQLIWSKTVSKLFPSSAIETPFVPSEWAGTISRLKLTSRRLVWTKYYLVSLNSHTRGSYSPTPQFNKYVEW